MERVCDLTCVGDLQSAIAQGGAGRLGGEQRGGPKALRFRVCSHVCCWDGGCAGVKHSGAGGLRGNNLRFQI